MTRNKKTIGLYSLLACSMALALGACGGGGSSSSGSGTGSFSLAITDAPVDNADEVWVEFTGVEVKPANGSSVSIDFDQPQQINLLALTGGTAEVLLDGEVLPAGRYEWLRLRVNASQGGDPMDDSYIVVNSIPHELRIPSGDQRGLQLNRPITIPEDGSTSFTIDFDLRKSVHESNNGYHLRPTLRLVNNYMYGALAGDVSDATYNSCQPDDIRAVYVFEGHGATPNDINIDGADDDAVATAPVEAIPDPVNPGQYLYSYTVAFLEAGAYTATFTCDAGIDAPDADDALAFVGTTDVTVVAGQTAILDF